MPIIIAAQYSLEVSHEPGEWDDSMSYLTSTQKDALGRCKEMQTEFPGKEITITKNTSIVFTERISVNDLEIDADRAEA